MWEGLQAVRREIEESVNTVQDNEEIRDGFQLRFVGKSYAKFVTGLPSETVLVPDNDWNNQEQNKDSQNIFITGDNLDALKHLVNAYSGAINVIYIDPPYNTGTDGFIYKDNFNFSNDDLKQKLGFTDTEVARLRALDGKCSHSAWLTFMLPRLVLAKRLLSNDGAIFISIDDNEYANLKRICDEIFDESNFIASFNWMKTSTPPSLSKNVRKKFEYVLCYCKQHDGVGLNGGIVEGGDMPLLNDGNAFSTLRFDKDSVFFRIPDGRYTAGRYDRVQLEEDIVIKNGKSLTDIVLSGNFKWKQITLDEEIKEGTIFHVKTEKFAMRYERVGERIKVPSNIISKEECNVGTNEDAQKEILTLFGNKIMDYPKPVSLIKYIINMKASDKDIILDFFAGSATTAHAVMQLNKDDGGNRKYIIVQWDEPVKSGSEAENQGFKTIDEISRERIKRAADQIGDTSGFKHYKLAKIADDLILDKIDEFDPNKTNLLSDDMVSPFSGEALGIGVNASGLDTLLTTWMVDDGFPINTKVEEFKFGNYIAYSPHGSRRLYFILDGWDSDATRDLLNNIGRNEISVQTIILYNYSFSFTTLTELKNNLKSVLDDDKKIEIIERF